MSESHIGKLELVDQVKSSLEAKGVVTTKTLVDSIVDEIISTIVENIKNATEVRLKNFGTFSSATLKAGLKRNIKTGESIQVPERKKLKFKQGSSLKTLLNA